MCIGRNENEKKMMMLMATTMSVAALAGCGNAEQTRQILLKPGKWPDTDYFRKTAGSYGRILMFWHLKDQSYEDNVWTDLIADELGYGCFVYSWIESSSDLYTQKFNAAIASGDIPDVAIVDKANFKTACGSWI